MSLYWRTVTKLDRFVPKRIKPLWDSPAGPKTVFFWAPAFKWCLVFAGIGDLSRPAHKLSATQSTALAATGSLITFLHILCLYFVVESPQVNEVPLLAFKGNRTEAHVIHLTKC